MNIRTTLSLSEARKKIFDIADEVQSPNVYYTLTEKGKPKVVIMSAEEFESWQETLEVMKDFPDLDKDIERAEKAFKTGDYITFQEFLVKEGFVVSDNRVSYDISHRSRKGRSKKSQKNR